MSTDASRLRQTECRSCGAPIVWVTTLKNKRMPLDAEPSPRGAFIFSGDPQNSTVSYIGPKDPYQGERYESHYSTCPQAEEWRKKR